VLLDADVVIRLFELGIWEKLAERTRITLAQQVYDEAGHYYDPVTMAKNQINLQPYKDRGLIDIVECDAAEAAQVRARCCRFAELHPGELESLTILCQPGQDALFCTADGGAIRAGVMLDLMPKLVSLEDLLSRVGLGRSFENRALWPLSERRFQRVVKQAGIDKVQGLGSDPQT
jgi:hypothetical protein